MEVAARTSVSVTALELEETVEERVEERVEETLEEPLEEPYEVEKWLVCQG